MGNAWIQQGWCIWCVVVLISWLYGNRNGSFRFVCGEALSRVMRRLPGLYPYICAKLAKKLEIQNICLSKQHLLTETRQEFERTYHPSKVYKLDCSGDREEDLELVRSVVLYGQRTDVPLDDVWNVTDRCPGNWKICLIIFSLLLMPEAIRMKWIGLVSSSWCACCWYVGYIREKKLEMSCSCLWVYIKTKAAGLKMDLRLLWCLGIIHPCLFHYALFASREICSCAFLILWPITR